MSVRLFVLGILYDHDAHGYDIKATAHQWGLERWAQIRDGSIYHALGKLEAEKVIEERNVEQAENHRPRYVYSISSKGREVFLELLRETLHSAPYEGRSIDLGLAFIHHLPPEERVGLLKQRHQSLIKARDELLQGFERLAEYPLAPWVRIGMTHSQRRMEVEIDWNLELIDTVGQWPYRP